MDVCLTMAEKLKDLRVERRMTLHQLSEVTGISTASLGNYESDSLRDMKASSIVALAKFYGVSTDYLLGLAECRTEKWVT